MADVTDALMMICDALGEEQTAVLVKALMAAHLVVAPLEPTPEMLATEWDYAAEIWHDMMAVWLRASDG